MMRLLRMATAHRRRERKQRYERKPREDVLTGFSLLSRGFRALPAAADGRKIHVRILFPTHRI
jgi:hypothetical protein